MTDTEEPTRTLFRPVGQKELELIQQSQNTRFPPRLAHQPIFYPVLNAGYAIQIARDWNAKYDDPKVGYVTRFNVKRSFLNRYDVQTVGGADHQEYWIPAHDLEEFNKNIVGKIEVMETFRN
jgi:hypothetical protein